MPGPRKTARVLSSEEARKALRVSACELSHLRVAKRLSPERRGNAYLYDPEEVKALARELTLGKPPVRE